MLPWNCGEAESSAALQWREKTFERRLGSVEPSRCSRAPEFPLICLHPCQKKGSHTCTLAPVSGVFGDTAATEKRSKKCALTAKWRPGRLALPGPLPGGASGCLPLSLLGSLPLFFLLLHWDVELIVDAWVLLVKDDLRGARGRTGTPATHTTALSFSHPRIIPEPGPAENHCQGASAGRARARASVTLVPPEIS